MKIILCGFMGCGKNSIGFRMAKTLGAKFIDMDQYIEEKEGRSITEIFASEGEASFRSMETKASEELMKKDNIVLAAGGGTVMNKENVRIFRENGAVICFLDVPVQALQERLKSDRKRPLLQRPDRREFIAKLHAERLPKYLAASDLRIDAGAPPSVISARTLAQVRRYYKKKDANFNK